MTETILAVWSLLGAGFLIGVLFLVPRWWQRILVATSIVMHVFVGLKNLGVL